MRQLYYRDLRRRLETIEEQYTESHPAVKIWIDEEGLPLCVLDVSEGVYWDIDFDGPMPPELFHYADPAARRILESRQQTAHGPP